MKNRLGRFGVLVFITSTWFVAACGDDGNTTSSGSSTSSSSSSGGAAGNGGAGGEGGFGGAGGAGGSSARPSPGNELVSGGDVMKSNKFKMVITFGGSTPAPGNISSPKHTLHGGLIGVTEGSK